MNNIVKGFLIFSFVLILGFSLALIHYANSYVFSNNKVYQSTIDINETRDKIDSMSEEEIEETIKKIESELNHLKSDGQKVDI